MTHCARLGERYLLPFRQPAAGTQRARQPTTSAMSDSANASRGRYSGPPTGAAALPAGTAIGAGFVIESMLAEGGMARVYLARDAKGEPVAVKVLRSELTSPRLAVERLSIEARACAQLRGPNVRKLIAAGSLADGAPYLVLTYFAGRTLAETLVGSKLAIAGVLQVGTEVAGALHDVHRQGLVHCDLSPSNVILFQRSGDGGSRAGAALIDFAACRHTGSAPTGGLTAVGTLAYLAPEQLSGGPIDARSDLYALGVLLYECLTGQRPASFHDSITPPSALRSDCSPDLDRAVLRALEREPDGRWSSARRLGEELAWLQARAGFGLLRGWQAAAPTDSVPPAPALGVSGVVRRIPED
jgi:eukaryotic-like serine/threonine-protein kinase